MKLGSLCGVGLLITASIMANTSAAQEQHLAPISIPGVQEPEEMLVEPFPTTKNNLSPPQRMLGEAFSRGNKPADWLPILNQIIAQYPNFPDAYVLRLATFCEGNDVAAIASDLDHALPFIDKSFTGKETIGSLLSMRAKMEYAAGNYVGAMDGLEKAVRADLHKADQFTNSGAVKPEQAASICVWTQPDIDTLVHRFPNDYRAYMFRRLYYSFFATWDESYLQPAIDNLNKAADLNRKSPLPCLFKAEVLANPLIFTRRLNEHGWKDAERDKLDSELVVEYSKALALDPNLLPALHGRALAYFHLKQYEKAIIDYDKILSLDPKDATIYNDRGLAKTPVGREYEAILDFDAAIKLKKRELMGHHSFEGRADTYIKTRQWDHAINDLTTAISLWVGGQSFSLMNVETFRALYPEYKAASNEAIARKLHQTFYPYLKYEDFSNSFLYGHGTPSFILADLYLKRSDVYLKKGDWHRASIEFRRVLRGFPDYGKAVDRWREIGRTRNAQNYIDMQTFDDARKDSVKLWFKEAYGPEESSGPYSLTRFELNCQVGRIRTLSFAKYDESGELIGTHEGGVWQAIVPDTLGETLQSKVCREK